MSVKVSDVDLKNLETMLRGIETHIQNMQLIQDRRLSPEIQKSWNEILGIVRDILKRLYEIINKLLTIDIRTQQNSDSYHTTISVGGDIKNEFPSKISETVWIRHNSLVDKALEERREILLKIIEIIGTIIKLPMP
jgi:ABC-type microcin C transport system permease subunit YejB